GRRGDTAVLVSAATSNRCRHRADAGLPGCARLGATRRDRSTLPRLDPGRWMTDRPMKIGIVSLWWPPHFGGAEMYVYRLACALRKQGVAVEAITSSPALPDRDNGDFELFRCGITHEPLEINAFRRYLAGPEHAAWCDLVVQWAQMHRFSHILCNAPLLRV